jgi:delta8-fatty-acid desaturase
VFSPQLSCSQAHAIPDRANNEFKAAIIIGKKLSPRGTCACRAKVAIGPDLEKLALSETESIDAAWDKKRDRERYATDLEKEEIEQDLRDNPSIDAETQQSIIRDYRALHDQIKEEGLYQCRYSEYAKESIRYGLLFSTFIYLLHHEWYLTSAMVLGMYWVIRKPNLTVC